MNCCVGVPLMRLAEQLHAAGLQVFPCRADKAPAVAKGESWQGYTAVPPDSPLIGVPVPDGAVIIDLDTYKGVTRQDVEAAVGCALPWDAALIQHTRSGGQHYAFSVDWPVRQGSDLEITGLDTRVAGKGYICTGPGYTPCGFGMFALVHPTALPRLPDECRTVLEHVAREAPTRTDTPTNDTDITAALAFVDPDCSRTEWVKIGLALRHHFRDDEQAGLSLFDTWSAGELGSWDCPDSYVVEHIESQWFSFKPDGATTAGTLFYEAIRQGWTPPPKFDSASAFGPGAAPSGDFNQLVDRIQAHGGDPKHTNDLIDSIQRLTCTPLQRATLTATLNRELKDAGLLTKPVREHLEAAGAVTSYRAPGLYGKNHTENAIMFLEECYPNSTLVRAEEVWYVYTGQAWAEMSDDDLRHQLTAAMAPALPQYSTVSGTYSMLASMAHVRGRKIGDTPAHGVLFTNGVLDLKTGEVLPHSPEYFTTNILPYNHSPGAPCGQWLSFLNDVFEGDQERVDLLQEWFGYMMSASYAYHKVMLLLGPKRCGKGTIGRVMEQVVGGQNFTGGSLHAFTSDPFLESLRTKPVMFIGDAEKRVARGTIDQVIERIKGISGNDAVTFSRKYKSTLSETLPARITIAANSVPGLFDDSGALASRLLVLPFDISYFGREDPFLLDRLLSDVEGIAAWALQGLARLNGRGQFTEPRASRVETQYIAETYSPLKQFVDEVCVIGGAQVVSSNDVYEAYRAWALNNQEDRILARRTFIGAFKDITRGSGCKYGPHRRDGEGVRGFKGLSVGAPADGTTAGAFQPRIVE